MSNKEALLKERLIQMKKDDIERLEFSDGLEFGLTDIKKHIYKIIPQGNDSIFSETDIEDLISKYDSKASSQNNSFSYIDVDLPLPLPATSSLIKTAINPNNDSPDEDDPVVSLPPPAYPPAMTKSLSP